METKLVKKKNGPICSVDIQKEICEKYKNGNTTSEISMEYSFSKTKILHILKYNDIMTRNASDKKRKYKIDEYIFNHLNENSLYWLGFIAADGNLYINPRGNKIIQFGLHQKDENHLIKLKEFFKTNKPIYYYDSKRKYKDGYTVTPEVKFNIHSSLIFDSICSYGIGPRKTFNMEFCEDVVNRHFFRGLFDGDGSIYSNNNGKNLAISLNGIDSVLTVFKNFIEKKTEINLKIYPNKSICRVRAYGEKALNILDLLYDNSNIYLDRKMELYKRWKSLKKN
jgi:hypothetical protein